MQTIACNICNKVFKSTRALSAHAKKKKPCFKELKCGKCGKLFTHVSTYNRHLARKTSCALIQGDPTKNIPKNSCQFCGKSYASKYTLGKHYGICSIKNGGMNILAQKVKQCEQLIETNKMYEEEIKRLRSQLINQETRTDTNIINNTITNNTTITNITNNITNVIALDSRDLYELFNQICNDESFATILKNTDPANMDMTTGAIIKICECFLRNSDHPQTHNMYLPNTEGDDMVVFRSDDTGKTQGKWCNDSMARMLPLIYSTIHNRGFLDTPLNRKSKNNPAKLHRQIVHLMSPYTDNNTWSDGIKVIDDEHVARVHNSVKNILNTPPTHVFDATI
jgi:hypothetical protein